MIDSLKKVYRLLNFTKIKLFSIVIFCFIVALLQVLSNVYLSVLIDSYISIGSIFITKTTIFLIILFTYTILKVFLRYIFSIISIKSEYNLNKSCIKNVNYLGDNVIVTLERINKLKSFFENSLETLFYIPILFVLTFVGAYILDPIICVFIIPVVLVSVLIDIKLSPRLIKSSKEYYDLERELFSFQKNTIENKEQIFLKDIENFVINLHNEKQLKFLNSSNRLIKSQQISYTPALLNEYMPTIVLIFISSIKVYYFKLSYGDFMGLLGLVVGVSLPFTKFLRVLISLKSLKFLIDDLSTINNRIFNLEENKPQLLNNFDYKNIISVKNLNFKYENSDKYILKDVSFNVENTKKIAIIGKSGSGKTTFIKLLLGLNNFNNYSIVKIFGLDILKNKRAIWNKIGYVDNNNYLFNRSVIYNITFKEALSNEEFEFLHFIGEKLKILDLINKNIILQEFGNNLSGGQKLKICIARALFRKSKLLILDEPTASFDEISESMFIEILREIDITTLVVTHRESLSNICDEVYEIKNSNLVRRNYG